MASNPDLKQAQQIANSSIAPVLAELAAQRKAEQDRAAAAQTSARAGSTALADILGGIAPQIQQDYSQAAEQTGAFAKGYSAAFQQGSEKMAADLQGFLAKQGSPQQVQSAGAAGADVIYGLGGSLPGQALAREGAAFTAAARQLPATAGLMGQQSALGIGRESLDKLSALDALVREAKGKVPGLVKDALGEISSQRLEAQEFGLKQRAALANEAAIRSQIGDRAFDNALNAAKAKTAAAQGNARIKQGGQRIANERARIQNDRDRIQLSRAKQGLDQLAKQAKLALDQDKFELALKREARMAKAPKKGGFTAKQKNEMRGAARRAIKSGFKSGAAPREVLEYLLAGDPATKTPPVPFSVAIKIIQTFARRKDADGNWKATLGWTKKR